MREFCYWIISKNFQFISFLTKKEIYTDGCYRYTTLLLHGSIIHQCVIFNALMHSPQKWGKCFSFFSLLALQWHHALAHWTCKSKKKDKAAEIEGEIGAPNLKTFAPITHYTESARLEKAPRYCMQWQ